MEATGVVTRTAKECQWCGEHFARTTDKMIHVHEQHPETIGRGRTLSRPWSCGCGEYNASSADTCSRCCKAKRS